MNRNVKTPIPISPTQNSGMSLRMALICNAYLSIIFCMNYRFLTAFSPLRVTEVGRRVVAVALAIIKGQKLDSYQIQV